MDNEIFHKMSSAIWKTVLRNNNWQTDQKVSTCSAKRRVSGAGALGWRKNPTKYYRGIATDSKTT
jgi:hypothetical protein